MKRDKFTSKTKFDLIQKWIDEHFAYLKDANFNYQIQNTSDCINITFKKKSGEFTWEEFKYDFLPFLELTKQKYNIDKNIQYYKEVSGYNLSREITTVNIKNILDDITIKDYTKMNGVVIYLYHKHSTFMENLFKFKK
jgi:hypothetical protein